MPGRAWLDFPSIKLPDAAFDRLIHQLAGGVSCAWTGGSKNRLSPGFHSWVCHLSPGLKQFSEKGRRSRESFLLFRYLESAMSCPFVGVALNLLCIKL